jgi:hypothetical protein
VKRYWAGSDGGLGRVLGYTWWATATLDCCLACMYVLSFLCFSCLLFTFFHFMF